MSRNKDGFDTEWICAWVPCADYPREIEKGRQTEKHYHNRVPKDRKERVCMHEKCMNIWRAKNNCILGSTQSKPTSTQVSKKNTQLNAWNIVKMQMECNAWSYSIKNTTPNQKISQKAQKFSKTPNLGLNAWRMKD